MRLKEEDFLIIKSEVTKPWGSSRKEKASSVHLHLKKA
jgi:hypothetical protein